MLYKWINPGKVGSEIEKIQEISLKDSGLIEKDLENIIATKIEKLVRTDQLMVIFQERSRQEEPDILALDENGTLFIFELKRWEANSENLLQALRYGQKFGRYSYELLNWFFSRYAGLSGQRKPLRDAHEEFFQLESPLNNDKFNHNQCFVIVANGLDYDTWDAVAFWNKKGLKIICLVYRLYNLNGELYIDFDPFGPIPDAPREPESGIFVVNTNKTYDPNAYRAMVAEKKASAYYDRKTSIKNIRASNTVCLYHVGVGIIGIGKAKTDYLKKDVGTDKDEEYFVPVEFEYLVDINQPGWEQKAVHSWEINSNFGANYKFRQTVFKLPTEYADFIKAKFKVNGV